MNIMVLLMPFKFGILLVVNRRTDRRLDRRIDRWTNRQTDRQTDR